MTRRVGLTDALKARLTDVASDTLASLRPGKSVRAQAPEFDLAVVEPVYSDAQRGADILAGRWSYGGRKLDVGAHGHPFSVSLPSERFARWVHGFSWVPDLLAVGGGQTKAGQLAAQWAEAFPARNPFVFAPDLLAERLFNWGRVLPGLLDPSGSVGRAYSGQARELRRSLPRLSPGLPVLKGHAAMVIYAVRSGENARPQYLKALDALDEQILIQILSDGGHVSRSPMATLEALDTLHATDQVLQATGAEGSRALNRAIDRLRPMLATLRHTDGGLGIFQGGHEGEPARIDALLQIRDEPAQPFGFGPNTGYHRLDAGGIVILLDMAGVAPRPFDLDAHLAPLAMEMSTPEGRLLVNCGWHPGAAPAWRRPVRASAAHTTLTLADRSPGAILEHGFLADVLGPAIVREPDDVRARRKEQSSGIWLESSHDGYKNDYGLVHRRRLFVGESGDDVRGEDTLFVPAGDIPVSRDSVPFALRFHFHPDVQVSLAQDLSSALLVQAGRAGWRFRTDRGPLAVEPSVYLGAGAKPVRCQQLVIAGNSLGDGDGQGRENRVRWSLRRLKGRTA